MDEVNGIRSKEEALAAAADMLRKLRKLSNFKSLEYRKLDEEFNSLLNKFSINYMEVREIVEQDPENKLGKEGGDLFTDLLHGEIDSVKLNRLKELVPQVESLKIYVRSELFGLIGRDKDNYDPEDYDLYRKNAFILGKELFGEDTHERLLSLDRKRQ